MRFPLKMLRLIISSPQLKGRHADQRKNGRNHPEPDYNRRLGPSLLFEVMMERGHGENAFACQFEGDHLDDDGNSFENE